jgi:hypothetical protein
MAVTATSLKNIRSRSSFSSLSCYLWVFGWRGGSEYRFSLRCVSHAAVHRQQYQQDTDRHQRRVLPARQQLDADYLAGGVDRV